MLAFVMWKYFCSSCKKKLYSNMCGRATTIMQKSPGFALFRSYDVAFVCTREEKCWASSELKIWMIFMCFSSPRHHFLSGFSHYMRLTLVRIKWGLLSRRGKLPIFHNRGTCVFNTTDFLLCITGIKMNIKGFFFFFETEFIAFFLVLNSYKVFFCFVFSLILSSTRIFFLLLLLKPIYMFS
jgi:hypothetical protein